jgi:hypothetical protein
MIGKFEVQRRAAVFYATRARKILSQPKTEYAIDAYAWDHDGGLWLSPIERGLWHDARGLDLVLYPQWPVAGFFVDFANPVARVAIECDGKAFHDPARDWPRQKAIEAKGWAVYRFPGWMCNQESVIESEDFDGRPIREESECVRRLRDIGRRHGIKRVTAEPSGIYDAEALVQSLRDHLMGTL